MVGDGGAGVTPREIFVIIKLVPHVSSSGYKNLYM